MQLSASIEEMLSLTQREWWRCWELKTNHGRQYWEFHLPKNIREFIEENGWESEEGKYVLDALQKAFYYDKSKNPNTSDLVLRSQFSKNGNEALKHLLQNIPTEKQAAFHATFKGFDFYKNLQMQDGNWAGDYGGPMFLLPGLIFVSYITQTPFEKPTQALMKQYMLNHQNKDGGWGLHIEDQSTMFGTVLQYIALRMLGEPEQSPAARNAQQWIIDHGGATQIPLWGKFYLAILGIYKWEGLNSFYPEAWILPEKLPIHPSRYWNHSRMVYMPMSYCFAVKLTAPSTPLLESLKTEIFVEKFETINWTKAKDACCEKDLYFTPSKFLSFANIFLNTYEKAPIQKWRKKAIAFLEAYIDAEDRHTNYINVGPVNQVLNSLCVWHFHGKDSEQFKKHVERWKDYLWVAEDGIKMNGYNGSQLWDTSFATQGLLKANMVDLFPDMSEKIYSYLNYTQIKKDEADYSQFYRDKGFGCWPFSTRDHDWPITDCTAEGIKCVLGLNKTITIQERYPQLIDQKRLEPAIDFLLEKQNKDGGWATYENIRGASWLEKLNPAHIFADIMVEYSYVECSSSSMQALAKFTKYFPNYKAASIQKALEKGKQFIEKKQNPDGSWYGSWAVCFTYGTWFGIEGLIAAGANTYKDAKVNPSIHRACTYLAGKQNEDGSWGESYLSCVNKEYVHHNEGQVINTAWALLGLIAANYPDQNAIEKGIAFLIQKQKDSGDWEQQSISGVFNANCMITYTSYRNVFPLWALGAYLNS